MSKPALGRGLGALLGGSQKAPARPSSTENQPSSGKDSPSGEAGRRGDVEKVPLKQIRPCSFQPRKEFPEETLKELADSIREQGIVQPLLVRRQGDRYELIAGERRWRAAQLAGLEEAPVIIRDADDRTVMELALVENLQRENLNPMEEAFGFSALIEQFQSTQEEAAAKVGKSRTAVANALRLLKLPQEVQAYIRDGFLSVGHAKVILGISSPDDQVQSAQKTIRENWSVRHLEEFVGRLRNRSSTSSSGSSSKERSTGSGDPHVADLENRLCERLGTRVSLKYRKGKGNITVKFFNEEELERVLDILGVKTD